MKGYMLDTNEALEYELKIIKEYEKYNEKIKDFNLGLLSPNDNDYTRVEFLNRCLTPLLKVKQNKLTKDKLYNHIKNMDSSKGIKNKTNMKNYK